MAMWKPLIMLRTIAIFFLTIGLSLPCIVPAAENAGAAHGASAGAKNTPAPSSTESRNGEISAQENAALLAKLKQWQNELKEVESQLDLQLTQLKQRQDELGKIRLQLAKMGAPSPVSTSPEKTPPPANAPPPGNAQPPAEAPSAPPMAATGSQKTRQKSPAAIKPLPAQPDYLQYGLPAIGLLVVLFLWTGWRYSSKRKSRSAIKPEEDAGLIRKPADMAPQETAVPAIAKPPPQPPQPVPAQPSRPKPDAVVPAVTNTAMSAAASLPPAPPQTGKTNEEDSMLEEARLYVTHGHPDMSANILKQVVSLNPANADAWSLLLSSYSSLGQVAEFEKSARGFLKHHKKDSPLWDKIQALGRSLDRNNPLYSDLGAISSTLSASAQHKPIGNLLLEMGTLSENDLQNCLNEFDPKKDGRFGGYLVKRKVITLAQLDEALLYQQEIDNEAQAVPLPSLSELENFMADFDPKKHGSISEFLAVHNASAPEQLRELLRQKANQGEVKKSPQDDNLH
jgi:hypothetical protein